MECFEVKLLSGSSNILIELTFLLDNFEISWMLNYNKNFTVIDNIRGLSVITLSKTSWTIQL